MSELRPVGCRFRLRDENKHYPRSSCVACGKTITTGLGLSCSMVSDPRDARIASLEAALSAEREKVERLQAEQTTALKHALAYLRGQDPNIVSGSHRNGDLRSRLKWVLLGCGGPLRDGE